MANIRESNYPNHFSIKLTLYLIIMHQSVDGYTFQIIIMKDTILPLKPLLTYMNNKSTNDIIVIIINLD